jgi:glutamine cyclotransferase
MYGKSNIRKVEVVTGRVLQQQDLSSNLFGEGKLKITLANF